MNATAAKRTRKGEDGERRCLITGEIRPAEAMIRFVVAPSGEIVPDVAEALPGRGLWITADSTLLLKAATGNIFAKAARAPVKVAPDLVERVQQLLKKRLAERLGLARRAGFVILGFDKVLKSLENAAAPAVLVEAADGAADGRRKLLQAAHAHALRISVIDCLSGGELSLALGRENVIHAAVRPGPMADRLLIDATRLSGLAGASDVEGMTGKIPVGNERNA